MLAIYLDKRHSRKPHTFLWIEFRGDVVYLSASFWVSFAQIRTFHRFLILRFVSCAVQQHVDNEFQFFFTFFAYWLTVLHAFFIVHWRRFKHAGFYSRIGSLLHFFAPFMQNVKNVRFMLIFDNIRFITMHMHNIQELLYEKINDVKWMIFLMAFFCWFHVEKMIFIFLVFVRPNLTVAYPHNLIVLNVCKLIYVFVRNS